MMSCAIFAGATDPATDGRILASIGHEGASVAGSVAPAKIAQDIMDAASPYLPQLRTIPIDHISIGQRVLPTDGLPIVGYAPNVRGLYMVTTHSGMTLAPILGRAAATEILDGASVDVLDRFRPLRFA
jgi:glycine/D-amino acid oxidase-like deaminating enzyme